MKKLSTVLMLTMMIIASSFTIKTNPVHETKIDADIVELAASQDMLSTLVAAVKAAGLVATLKGDGPFTVFAPTNEAFAKLPKGTVEDLLKPENKAKLAKILSYHVISGKVMSKDLKNGQMAKTVEGSEVKVTMMNGKVMINNANVIKADVMADNGVVHIIDTVIMPPM
jgi:uncharacterized surface protein with fasciclin (FAS1) repeats